jgi:formyl-CoA transferase
LLADLGADVVKIEAPGGDGLRHYPSTLNAESRAFLGVNRGKRGIVLDLKQADGISVLMRLVSHADVFVHNFRPGVPERLGVDYGNLNAINPRLIYCALTGYGETGPLKGKAGYDQVLQCFTGIATFQGGDNRGFAEPRPPESPPQHPEIVAGSVVDFYAAALLAHGVSAALFYRERTGEGQYVGLSLLGAALALQAGRFIWAENEGPEINRDLRSGGITGIHPTRAGDLYISANTPHFWRALCDLTELPHLAENTAYDTVRKRALQANEIVPVIREALKARTALEWETVFGERVPCCAVRPLEDMFDHPQVLAQGLVATLNNPRTGEYRSLRKPLKFGAAPGPEPFGAPSPGQHTDEVLSGAGYTAEELRDLRLRGVLGD